jgi:hypothetical protein
MDTLQSDETLYDDSRRNFSRRDFLILAGTAAAYALSSPTTVFAQSSSEDQLSVQAEIENLNTEVETLGFRLEPGFTFGTTCKNLDEMWQSINSLGGMIETRIFPEDIHAVHNAQIPTLIHLMTKFELPVTKIIGNNLQYPFLAYTLDSTQYEFHLMDDNSGYYALIKSESDINAHEAATTKGGVFDDAYQALDACIPLSDPYETKLSKELGKYFKYDSSKVQLVTCEGTFPDLFDTSMFDPTETRSEYGLLVGSSFRHVLWTNSFFAKCFRGQKYEGMQMGSADIDIEPNIRNLKAEHGEDLIPEVLCDTYSVKSKRKMRELNEQYEGKDPDKIKMEHIISTTNISEKIEVQEGLVDQIYICSVVDEDAQGFFLPENRSYVEGYPDNFFLFPELTSVLDVELSVEVNETDELRAFLEYWGRPMIGASMATARAAAVFSSVMNHWLSLGNSYTHEGFKNLILDLCPLVDIRSNQFGTIKGRVPDIKRFKNFFEGYDTYLPQTSNN